MVLEIGMSSGDVLRRDVVHLACPGIVVGTDSLRPARAVRLTTDLLRPWAGEGIGAAVNGPSELAPYVIGPMG